MKFFTIGRMSERLQRAPAAIEAAIEGLGIKPALELNGVAYYGVPEETAIDDHLRAVEIERIQKKPRAQ